MKTQVKRQIRQRVLLRSLISLVLLIGVSNLALPLRLGQPGRVEAKTSVTADLPLRSEAQLRNEANLFQTAMNEIGRISSMQLTTVKDLAVANAIVDKHVSNLRYARSKLIVMGLSDATFGSAVKRRAADQRATEEFVVELAQQPTSIFKVTGGQALGDRIRRSLAADAAKIRQVADQLKRASEEIKAKLGHHASRNLSITTAMTAPPAVELKAEHIAVIVIVAAVIIYPPLGLVLLQVSQNAATVLLFAGVAAALVARPVADAVVLLKLLNENAGSEERRDRVAECHDGVDRRYRRCRNDAEDQGIYEGPAKAVCYAEWLVASAACLVN